MPIQIKRNRFKFFFMRYMWRIQQSQIIISIFFWALTITGIFYDKVAEKLHNFGLSSSNIFGGITIMFVIVIIIIVIMGVLFDHFKFWKEQSIVNAERSPFNLGKFTPKEIIVWLAMVDPTPEHKRILKQLIEHNLEEDEIIRKAYEQILEDMK